MNVNLSSAKLDRTISKPAQAPVAKAPASNFSDALKSAQAGATPATSTAAAAAPTSAQ
jgi:hypothetical protein